MCCPPTLLIHTHNSAATVRLTDRRRTWCASVRLAMECARRKILINPAALRPVMSVKTRVAQVREIPAGKTIGYGGLFTTERDSQIASLPVGFGEGYPRALFNKGIVLIHGRAARWSAAYR